MKAAEFFISIGVKNANKSKKDIQDVNVSLKDAKIAALEMKAAIVGAAYALGLLTRSGANVGASLRQFSALTGRSSQRLQDIQSVARKFNVPIEEATSSVYSLIKAMTQLATGNGAPEGLQAFQRELKGTFDINKAYKDEMYSILKFQEVARKSKMPANLKSYYLESFGLSPGFSSLIMRGAFTKDNLKYGPRISDTEAASLESMGGKMNQIGHKFETSFQKMLADKGPDFFYKMDQLADKLILLTEKLITLLSDTKFLEMVTSLLGLATYLVEKTGNQIPSNKEVSGEKPLSIFTDSSFKVNMAQNLRAYNMARDAWNKFSTNDLLRAAAKTIINNVNTQANIQVDGTKSPEATGRVIQREISKPFHTNPKRKNKN